MTLIGKRLELLKDAVPGASRLAVFVDPGDASDVSTVKAVPAAARALGLDLRVIEVRSADLEAAFAAAAREGAQGLYVSQNPFFFARRAEIAAMALRARLPAVDGYREFAHAGGLISYAASLPDFYRRFGVFVDKISQRRKRWRLADRTGDEIRAGRQPQDGEGARPHHPGIVSAARRRGDRMRRREFMALLAGAAASGAAVAWLSPRARSSRRPR